MKLSQRKRLDILNAAETLFFQQGFEQTSMDQVASLAGASKRTVYNHFENKGVLFQAILVFMFEKVRQEKAVIFNKQHPIAEQLTQIAVQEVALLTSEEFLKIAKVAFMQMLQQPDLAKSLANNSMGCMQDLVAFLEAASDAHVLHIDDAEFAAKQFVYQLKSLIFYPLLYGFERQNGDTEEKVISETVKMFLARYQR
ncbi:MULTISPECIES: TetR/AcrR family transcriptional regulator [Pseudoalteromonas]|jgi:TetR/AcrR family transcriptional regulator of autoinduction and epiphytic fitness|uniref:TetR/AcrR family transcriptional regulator n=1 Tax=Pseudoalteromonas lipolytica TaxID=570156 RepID=A0AAD0S0N6_9GAMM|nr:MULTISPECIES: TetR/AcrR family transcriptional regulator [Pseudoalteromonas]AXV65682.1 TetR/AcrR family transcriptional regulator [Pseudoalteromonas donghaensis]EWH07495.1 TetR family transcriptional regulator [Pseudoalteromonas lipolytica SCSIO 04301]MCC9659192.1 TetR/AcrR family transcriptional regulator [Pseudoalteromonas sp. MB41]QLJ07220.1 TetR/AcrR family transcriptional regulator [Pseudoalteromonas sp. JSTW]QMW13463.1 TetR/AcrR family transcriptional regulator [Pseudoalteromonas sp. |tara:strand:- start:8175 stop:8768 length:594 start_codon:yes stop_codon:yes gene_type:complete